MFNSGAMHDKQDTAWKLQSLKLQCLLPGLGEISTQNSAARRRNDICALCW